MPVTIHALQLNHHYFYARLRLNGAPLFSFTPQFLWITLWGAWGYAC